ncbi:DUF2788 domain-containing protein [Endozoicomonas numazuensis]|uniref:DUF2788 domain-containing protein n=1 Tax=Endozoicomonas numazuensis TaxID=1137799 RepID=A0A081NMC1_9GAMM|nr:DUF2788 domain-containing protein [Endozoicomonas numazuensis]KEQ19594.1 hypothetical protein GZ78_06750 [Endozoicomonas numazuensis]
MDIDNFESLMMKVLLTALVLFMGFIVYDLAKKSKAGKFGTMVLFGALCFGVLGFVLKGVLMKTIGG